MGTFKSFFFAFITACVILGVAVAIIAYGRGYRLGTDGSLNSTGIIVVQSDPSGAQIVIDGKLRTATPATLTLPPNWYDVTVTKEGYQPWTKRMKIQGEVVAKVDALLIPLNPSLTALTASGVLNPTLSPDGSKLAYIIPDPGATTSAGLVNTKPGIWVLDLIDKPLGLNRDARQIAQSTPTRDFADATLTWSPDNAEVLATLSPTVHYLFPDDTLTISPALISNIKLLQSDWKTIKEQRTTEQLVTVPQTFTDMATTSARLLTFSPDETKILYEATAAATLAPVIVPPLIGTNPTEEVRQLTPKTLYVYDIKEDRNYKVGEMGEPIRNDVLPVSWLPTSRHLLRVTAGRVEIMDFDGVNSRTAYAGPFEKSFAVPWASGGKIVISTNLNSAASTANNLYIVNLR